MLKTMSSNVSVTAVMLQKKSKHIWGEDNWSLLGLLPGVSKEVLEQAESEGTVHFLLDLKMQIYPLHCDSYYHNLMSGKPQVYVVSQQDPEKIPLPLLITVDYDEAAAYMETDEQVFNTDLPEELCQWLEGFVLEHYQPEKQIKRRREKWHDGEPRA